MTRASDPDFLVLHALRLKGFAETPVLAAIAQFDEQKVATCLETAQADGAVTRRDGRISGWSLTPSGRAKHKDLVAAELEASGARGAVEECYSRFLAVNGDLLAVCTDWQLRDGALNDHSDADYDAAVVARLRATDDVVQPVCADLAKALARFDHYGRRLAHAIDEVERGNGDWFAKPVIDSYHTVWFELHEDLLVTLGIERSTEGGA